MLLFYLLVSIVTRFGSDLNFGSRLQALLDRGAGAGFAAAVNNRAEEWENRDQQGQGLLQDQPIILGNPFLGGIHCRHQANGENQAGQNGNDFN